MTLDEFQQSLAATEPPAGLTHALAGLWWDAKGDWTRAHEGDWRRNDWQEKQRVYVEWSAGRYQSLRKR
jgi:hypothetical protein